MRIVQCGNFTHHWNTENHIAAALREWGHRVSQVQLSDRALRQLPTKARTAHADLILYTHTSHLVRRPQDLKAALLQANKLGITTAAFHLDRYWDLAREAAISTEPWFTGCDLVMTADGGNDDRFAAAGVTHSWVAPACHGPDTELIGIPNDAYRCKVAFVGSWEHYHPEWPWRLELIRLLADRYGSDFRVFPEKRHQPIRGQDLSDLYASVDVVVGDSIFAGTSKGLYYTSDRPYETLGRRGCLVQPFNPPLEDSFTDGVHLRYYMAQDPRSLFTVIDELLADPVQRDVLATNGHAEVQANHLYRHRVAEMLQRISEHKVCLLGWPGLVRHNTWDAVAIRETWLDDVYHAKDAFQPGDLVLDCGANVGAFTIYAALQGADVIAVEPVPNNLAQLRKNIQLAGVADRVTIIESGVGEKAGTIYLDYFDTDESQSAYRRPEGTGVIQVPIRTIADILNGRSVKFLKMDIEGSERWALPDAPLHLAERIAIETHNTLDPGTTHQRVKDWVGRTHHVTDTGGHSEGYVYGVRKDP